MDLSHLLQQGETHLWLFIPTAIFLGAMHGLEPGHSKTMMAAFIIAIRGTVVQAGLLGLSAAISHSLIIWLLAAGALHYGSAWTAQSAEPYIQLISAVMIGGLAVWLFWRTRRDQQAEAAHHASHEDEGPHGGQMVDTGHGLVELAIFEENVPARFRVYFYDSSGVAVPPPSHGFVRVETSREDGRTDAFTMQLPEEDRQDGAEAFLEAGEILPEPHAFTALLTIGHKSHEHVFEIIFSEDDHHHHHHADLGDLTGDDYADAHERAHAEDIARRFRGRSVTTPQIIWFGITGGLMPCPAAFTILLVCLQMERFTLGFTLVGFFSLGLAITMVASGVLAAVGVRHAEKRFRGFGRLARRAPYLSVVLMTGLAVFFAVQGWVHFADLH